MGLSVSFANMVMASIVAKSAPADRAVLARFPPAMIRIGDIGLVLLWITGLAMLFQYYGGTDAFQVLPWQFHVKLTGVVLLTGLVGYIHGLLKKAKGGDMAAAARIPQIGRFAFLTALIVVVMAVLTFN